VLSRVLGVTGRILIGLGLLVLGFAAFQLWGTNLEESRQQDQLTDELVGGLGALAGLDDANEGDAEPAVVAEALGKVDPATAEVPVVPPEGEPLGIIEIPRIDLARVMVQGTSRADLKKGPGHYISTPMPGQPGNVGIAGHRTTYGAPFNRIDEIRPGDEIIVSTSQGRFTYRAIPAPGSTDQAWYTVKPNQSEVLADMGDDRITLTACHPEYSARQRIVVHGVLEGPAAPASPEAEPVDHATGTPSDDFDQGMGSTPEELPRALAWLAAAAALLLVAWMLGRKTRLRWLVWLVATPLVLVLVWNGYVHMDRYLPAI
jgi:sortase A